MSNRGAARLRAIAESAENARGGSRAAAPPERPPVIDPDAEFQWDGPGRQVRGKVEDSLPEARSHGFQDRSQVLRVLQEMLNRKTGVSLHQHPNDASPVLNHDFLFRYTTPEQRAELDLPALAEVTRPKPQPLADPPVLATRAELVALKRAMDDIAQNGVQNAAPSTMDFLRRFSRGIDSFPALDAETAKTVGRIAARPDAPPLHPQVAALLENTPAELFEDAQTPYMGGVEASIPNANELPSAYPLVRSQAPILPPKQMPVDRVSPLVRLVREARRGRTPMSVVDDDGVRHVETVDPASAGAFHKLASQVADDPQSLSALQEMARSGDPDAAVALSVMGSPYPVPPTIGHPAPPTALDSFLARRNTAKELQLPPAVPSLVNDDQGLPTRMGARARLEFRTQQDRPDYLPSAMEEVQEKLEKLRRAAERTDYLRRWAAGASGSDDPDIAKKLAKKEGKLEKSLSRKATTFLKLSEPPASSGETVGKLVDVFSHYRPDSPRAQGALDWLLRGGPRRRQVFDPTNLWHASEARPITTEEAARQLLRGVLDPASDKHELTKEAIRQAIETRFGPGYQLGDEPPPRVAKSLPAEDIVPEDVAATPVSPPANAVAGDSPIEPVSVGDQNLEASAVPVTPPPEIASPAAPVGDAAVPVETAAPARGKRGGKGGRAAKPAASAAPVAAAGPARSKRGGRRGKAATDAAPETVAPAEKPVAVAEPASAIEPEKSVGDQNLEASAVPVQEPESVAAQGSPIDVAVTPVSSAAMPRRWPGGTMGRAAQVADPGAEIPEAVPGYDKSPFDSHTWLPEATPVDADVEIPEALPVDVGVQHPEASPVPGGSPYKRVAIGVGGAGTIAYLAAQVAAARARRERMMEYQRAEQQRRLLRAAPAPLGGRRNPAIPTR